MTTVMSTPHLPDATHVSDLEDWGLLDEATGEAMQTRGVTLWEDGNASAGVWECTAGPSRWLLETHEVIHLVRGRMTVTPDGGAPTEISAGDVAIFPRGWSGTWDIHEPVRKVYAIF